MFFFVKWIENPNWYARTYFQIADMQVLRHLSVDHVLATKFVLSFIEVMMN
jgi:hypothetical protein